MTRQAWDDDCRAWGLTTQQRIHYLRRISQYHGAKARWHGERAARYSRLSRRWLLAALLLLAVSQLIGVLW